MWVSNVFEAFTARLWIHIPTYLWEKCQGVRDMVHFAPYKDVCKYITYFINEINAYANRVYTNSSLSTVVL